MAYDMKFVQNLLSIKRMIIYAALGVLIFAGWGLVPVFLGSNFFGLHCMGSIITRH